MRLLDDSEVPLVKWLLDAANINADLLALKVQSMNDGGMGSLAFAPADGSRKFGRKAAECHFKDSDGTLVSVTLDLDDLGHLFEMDLWRVDFSALVRWPSHGDIVAD